MRRSGNQVQVNVQLIDAETGAHLWADRFETDRTNPTEAQTAIGRERHSESLHGWSPFGGDRDPTSEASLEAS